MRTGPDFGQILDDKLEGARFASASREERRPLGHANPGPRPVFLFGDFQAGFCAGPGRPAMPSGASPWTPVDGARPGAQTRPARPARPARRLTPRQQQAADALRSLGAGLPVDFSDAELKSAFRALARRFHPDRHPGSADAERASLSRAFAAACDAYRTLTAVH